VARTVNDAECAVCGDAYPSAHLLAAAGDDGLRVCPACAFDGDIFLNGDHATAYLAYQIDRLPDSDLATPAGWAGPAALLAASHPAASASGCTSSGAPPAPSTSRRSRGPTRT
jgi:hypothetical protein